MTADGKLVRDGIPGIIRATGAEPITRIAEWAEYRQRLRNKLSEELAEYLAAETDADAIEELADILEVVHTLSKLHGEWPEQLEKIRAAKQAARGGFGGRIVWHGNQAAE